MTLRFNRKQTIAVIAAFLIAIMIILFVYFKMYLPSSQNLELKQSELKTSQNRLSLLQTKTMHMTDNTFDNTISLQKKVPVKALSDQLLLDFEKAETISGTSIKEIDFTEGSTNSSSQSISAPSTAAAPSASGSSTASTSNNSNTSTSTTTSSAANSQVANNAANGNANTASLPMGMNSTLVTLSLEASGYFELEDFIRQLESSTRILEVNQIDVKGPNEITTNNQKPTPLTFKITVSAFYMPGLVDLSNQVPKMAIPAAGGKNDPFQGLPDIAAGTNTP
ncbi:hypothetical protein [Heyndrickxia acidicola]|uniref:Pilus assembly protein PilO n=1 Tax=Heyndrickxia acidicola TaxID=209389 RepID=A0ABU6MNK5_9BACI|nr:hypothetical protein [Heyndrickxia acidicola]MED1204797.1 hypothetical protein [Heyndrickxia acidicola]